MYTCFFVCMYVQVSEFVFVPVCAYTCMSMCMNEYVYIHGYV